MRTRTCFFMLIFLFAALFLHAEDFPVRKPPMPRSESMNFNGRKMPRRTENFSLIGVKVETAGEVLTISLFFTEPVNASSVQSESIFINETPLPRKTEFLFNKTRHMVRFTLSKSADADSTFSLRVTDMRSYDGRILDATEIPNLEADSFFKCSRKEQTWKKS